MGDSSDETRTTSTASTPGALAGRDADLVVTQDLCAVCVVSISTVDAALTHLGCRADVLTIDPHPVAGVTLLHYDHEYDLIAL